MAVLQPSASVAAGVSPPSSAAQQPVAHQFSWQPASAGGSGASLFLAPALPAGAGYLLAIQIIVQYAGRPLDLLTSLRSCLINSFATSLPSWEADC